REQRDPAFVQRAVASLSREEARDEDERTLVVHVLHRISLDARRRDPTPVACRGIPRLPAPAVKRLARDAARWAAARTVADCAAPSRLPKRLRRNRSLAQANARPLGETP